MQLRDIQARDTGDLFYAAAGLVHEDADAKHALGGEDFGGSFGRDVARAARVEIEAHGGSAGLDGGGGVGLIGDAADFQNHAATSCRRAATGSPDFMRCSPTRNAV